MLDLPDYNGATVAAEAPVTPESVNAPERYSEAFRDHFAVEHRVEDFEHGPPLAPQACALFKWNGAGYDMSGASNIASIAVNGTGDVTVTMTIAARTSDNWFPVCAIQRSANGNPAMWWDYDDGANRTASKCRLRFMEFTGGSDIADAHCDFLFFAFMHLRASGADGNSTPTAINDVRARICVDGVESAEHRTDLLQFCASHRDRWTAEHDDKGRHLLPAANLAAFQIERPTKQHQPGTVLWQHGPLDGVSWTEKALEDPDPLADIAETSVTWRVDHGARWRSALFSFRHSTNTPPPMLNGIMLRDDDFATSDDPTWVEGGKLRLPLTMTTLGYWLDTVSVGVVLTGLP
jgi:hypothetical protein